jgi:hypothetical protein
MTSDARLARRSRVSQVYRVLRVPTGPSGNVPGHFYSIDERHGEEVVREVLCTTDDRGGTRRTGCKDCGRRKAATGGYDENAIPANFDMEM